MSIVTRTGDGGTTAMMYNRRVPKHHPRVAAYGDVDELNAALGCARAAADHPFVREHVLTMQKDLVVVMGELATLPEDLPRLDQDGFPRWKPEMLGRLDELAARLEAEKVYGRGWVMPGANASSAALDLARTVCRRAERQVSALQEAGQLANPAILTYLNRLSDVLWLLARWVEKQQAPPGGEQVLV